MSETLRLLQGVRGDGEPMRLQEHLHRHGPMPLPRGGLLDVVDASGLRGRGGARFATGAKLRAVAQRRGRKVVVANGTECEPVSGKDKVLLRHVPHLVLDGATLAAGAVGAREAIVAVSERATVEQAALEGALRERGRAGTDGAIRLRVEAVPHTFVTGEETALVNVLGGGPALPTTKPPRPYERGVGGAPTLVQNVETLAHLALIARRGPHWFRELGTEDDPGTALVTLSGAVTDTGVYEIALGTPLRDVLAQARGPKGPLRAVLVGGYFGSWIDAETAGSLRLDGASLGAGALVLLPERSCAAAELARVARYLAEESAGQCGPCVYGLGAVAGALDSLRHSRGTDDDLRVRRWLEQIRGRGACRHPDGAAGFVGSALAVFADELALHARGRRCGARDLRVLPGPHQARKAA